MRVDGAWDEYRPALDPARRLLAPLQRLPHSLHELDCGERFLYERQPRIDLGAAQGWSRVAGHVEHTKCWRLRMQPEK